MIQISAELFLLNVKIPFEPQPSSSLTKCSKVANIKSLLSDKAKQKGATDWQNDSSSVFSYSAFTKELVCVFDPIFSDREAARGLQNLKQRAGSEAM